jgi:hypothetical protein
VAHFFITSIPETSSDLLYALSDILGHNCGLIDVFTDDDDDDDANLLLLLLLLHLSSAMVVSSAPDFPPPPPPPHEIYLRPAWLILSRYSTSRFLITSPRQIE